MSGSFLDTNVLLYAFNLNDHRQPTAVRLLESGCAISVQCLNEFAFVARRKLHLSWEQIAPPLRIIVGASATIVPLSVDLHRLGLQFAERYRLSVYDGMIAGAAHVAGCDTLYSEDMHDGLVIDGRLRIVNPFAPVA